MDKIIILQVNEHDANRILTLVQREATAGKIWNSYWERLANQIQTDIMAQRNVQFFQCFACVEQLEKGA